MTIRSNQRGVGTPAVLMILAAVAAIVTIGWFTLGRQKDTPEKPLVSTSESESKPAPKPSLQTGSINPGFGVDLRFQYPADWEETSAVEGSMPLSPTHNTVETITITSPSKQTKVIYRIGANGGLGGACDPDSGAKLRSKTTVAVPGFSVVRFVEAQFNKQTSTPVVPGEENKMVYAMALMDATKAEAAEVGKSDCQLYLANVVELKEEQGVTLLDASVQAQQLTEQSSSDDFAKLKETAEYKAAKAVLLSTTVK